MTHEHLTSRQIMFVARFRIYCQPIKAVIKGKKLLISIQQLNVLDANASECELCTKKINNCIGLIKKPRQNK